MIRRDLDRIKAQGFRGVLIEADYGMTAKYLSPEWFSLVRTGVQEEKKRGMTVAAYSYRPTVPQAKWVLASPGKPGS